MSFILSTLLHIQKPHPSIRLSVVNILYVIYTLTIAKNGLYTLSS